MDFVKDYTEAAGLILAVLTPLVTAVAQQPTWSTRVRSVVGAFVSLIVGFLTVAAAGELGDGTTLLTTLGVVVAAAEAAYQKLWQPSGVAAAIELATSSKPESVTRSSYLDDLGR